MFKDFCYLSLALFMIYLLYTRLCVFYS
jgi:hypothetical protein